MLQHASTSTHTHHTIQYKTTQYNTPPHTTLHTPCTRHTQHTVLQRPVTSARHNTVTHNRTRRTSIKVAHSLQRYTWTICLMRTNRQRRSWPRPMHSNLYWAAVPLRCGVVWCCVCMWWCGVVFMGMCDVVLSWGCTRSHSKPLRNSTESHRERLKNHTEPLKSHVRFSNSKFAG